MCAGWAGGAAAQFTVCAAGGAGSSLLQESPARRAVIACSPVPSRPVIVAGPLVKCCSTVTEDNK